MPSVVLPACHEPDLVLVTASYPDLTLSSHTALGSSPALLQTSSSFVLCVLVTQPHLAFLGSCKSHSWISWLGRQPEGTESRTLGKKL